MSILTLIVNSLKGLVQGFFSKTDVSSKDGSKDLNGNGKLEKKSNGSTSINWNNIIILILVGVGMYLIPSPFQSTMRYPIAGTSHSETAVRGIPDTVWVSQPVHYGADADVDTVSYVEDMDPVLILAMPDYVENVATIKDSTVVGIIRATAYPYWRNWDSPDTLDIDVILEWNLQARPLSSIERVDTVYSMDSVWIQPPTPFIERPAVVAGVTLIGVAILYGIVESIKGSFD